MRNFPVNFFLIVEDKVYGFSGGTTAMPSKFFKDFPCSKNHKQMCISLDFTGVEAEIAEMAISKFGQIKSKMRINIYIFVISVN